MTDDDYKFSLAGIRKKTKGTDKHSDLIKNQINMLEAIILTIREVSKYGTERQIDDEINRRIRACQNILGMWGDRRSAILYFEETIRFSEVKDTKKFTVEHVIPISAAVKKYKDGGDIKELILNPVTLITRESDDRLRKAQLVKTGEDFDFPFRRYHKVGIKIKDLDAREIDCEAYTMEDHFALIRRVPELQQVLDEMNYEN